MLERIENTVKRVIGHPAYSTSLLEKSLCIFCYHEVSDSPSVFCEKYDLNVLPEIFKKQLDVIGQYFNFISPLQLIEGNYSTPAALITFDDGMPGYFRNAVPSLKERNIPSLIFLNMLPVEGGIFWSGLITYLTNYDSGFKKLMQDNVKINNKIPMFLQCNKKTVNDYLSSQTDNHLLEESREFYGAFATLDDLDTVSDNSLVSFGNHLLNHYNVLTLSQEELKEEYFTNEDKILGYPNGLPFFSYPFGQPGTCFNEYHTELIHSFGAKAVFSSSGNINKMDQGSFFDRLTIGNKVQTINDLLFKMQIARLRSIIRQIKRKNIN